MRISTEELYGIDPKDFIGVPYEIVIQNKLTSCRKEIKVLAKKMGDASVSYEEISAYSQQYKYYSGAIEDLTQEYEEMGLTYVREK